MYGKVWGKRYARVNGFDCKSCSESVSIAFVYIVNILILLLYIAYSIKQSLIVTTNGAAAFYMREAGLHCLGRSESLDKTDILMKHLLNYIQTIVMVNSVEIGLPDWITFVPDLIGTPIDSMKQAVDCSDMMDESRMPAVFTRIMWSFCMSLVFLVCILLVYLILTILGLKHVRKIFIYNGLVFILLFLQPDVVSVLLSSIACRVIGGKQFILSDVTY